ncbi:hypothetical protein CcCBS67573_g02056 [Chytriomyces confervae]|uniref:Transmembrane protein 198 n=1 Tax=Chytriomyces confervae TaxID=246404 RepID=A0A507FKA9_9FUNG|nr:hypothetical protein HDU80_008940 [Chytriomyces hyalinus]TPX76662.1 hypothetical protein CcCBS67573_g02056 [Chytriomyces confervae]
MHPLVRNAARFLLLIYGLQLLLALGCAATPNAYPDDLSNSLSNIYHNASTGLTDIYNDITSNPPANSSGATFSSDGTVVGLIVTRTVSPPAGMGGAVLIIAGFAYAFMGKRAYFPSLYLSGFLTFGVIAFVLLDVLQMTWHRFGQYADWIYFFSILPVSILSGFVTKKIPHLGVIASGALSGFMWSLALLFTGLGASLSDTTHMVFLLVLTGLGIATIFFMEHMALVVATAFVGSFFVVIGIDLFACTGFCEVMNRCIDGALPHTAEIPGPAWALLAAFGALGMSAWYVQTRSSPPPIPDITWNPAYWIFGAAPPNLPPPTWFKMPSGKAPGAPAPPPPPPFFSVANLVERVGLKW